MDELIRLAERRDALDSYLRAELSSHYSTAQLFGIRYFSKEWDCKNYAFDPDKLQDMGVVVTNLN